MSSAIVRYKLKKKKCVVLSETELSSEEKETLSRVREYSPNQNFSFIQHIVDDRPVRDVYMTTSTGIYKICKSCFLKIDHILCEHCCATDPRNLEMIEAQLCSFMEGKPFGSEGIELLLSAKRSFYSQKVLGNCIYICFLFLSDFRRRGLQYKASVYAKIGRTSRSSKERHNEHSNGIHHFVRTLNSESFSAFPIRENILWFPTTDDYNAENELKSRLKDILMKKVYIGADKHGKSKYSTEIIKFDITIPRAMYKEIESRMATDLIRSTEKLSLISPRVKSFLSWTSSTTEEDLMYCILDICEERITEIGVRDIFELIALRYATEFREHIYKSIVENSRNRSPYFQKKRRSLNTILPSYT